MRVKISISFTIIVLLFSWLRSAPDFQSNVRKGMDSLLKGYDRFDGDAMKQARDVLLSAEKVSHGDVYARYHVAYADYVLSVYYFKNDKEKAKNYLSESFAQLDKVIQAKSSSLVAEAYALYASGLGFTFGLGDGAADAPVIGAKIEEYFARALKEGKNNPRVNLLRGISLLHTPEMWGGGLDKAMPFFKKSLALFAKETADPSLAPRWGHAEAHYYLGSAFALKGDASQAEKCFQDSLKINPEFGLALKALAEWQAKPRPSEAEKQGAQ